MAICIEYATPTVCAATTKTQINGGDDIVLPTGIKSILAFVPILAVDAGITAGSAKVAKVIVESSDIPVGIAPLELLCEPIGGGLGAAISAKAATPPKYAVNIPVNGGERISIYGEGLSDPTTDPMIACAIICSTEPPMGPQRKGEVSAQMVASGTTAVAKANGSWTISGAHRIVEVLGAAVNNVVTTLEGHSMMIELVSSGFVPNLPLRYPTTPISGGVGTAIDDLFGGLARFPIDIGLKSPSTVSIYGTQYATTISAAPDFVAAIMYE